MDHTAPHDVPFIPEDIDNAATRRYNAETRERLRRELHEADRDNNRFHIAPTNKQLLGRTAVVCLILNRTIGSGIFAQPVNILAYSGSSGGAILIWFSAGVIILCVLACWLELGLNVPFYNIVIDGIRKRVSTPRSGGDKNYLEYIYKLPELFMTCFFGIPFIVFGNLAGNAIQFGIFMMVAINPTCQSDECRSQAGVVLWAIFVLTACSMVNVATREFSIRLNNLFAFVKVAFIVVMAFVGIIYGSAKGDGCRQITFANQGDGGSFGDVVMALFFAMYPYGGYEQPFYVLAEVAQPQANFAKAATWTMVALTVFFPLINVSYLCMAPYSGNDSLPDNMAIAMFARLSGKSASELNSLRPEDNTGPVRAAAVILAVFIFGNIMAQTFTASRVKQEIAKEGILPMSDKLSASGTTFVARLSSRGNSARRRSRAFNPDHLDQLDCDIDDHLEEAPIGATLLHWTFAVLLVLVVGCALPPTKAYKVLTYLKAYTILGVLGFLTVGGLLYLKLDSAWGRKSRRHWAEKATWKLFPEKWPSWVAFLPPLLATLSLATLLFGSFAPPSSTKTTDIPWWILPTVSWAVCLSGVLWWCGLQGVQWQRQKKLVTRHIPFIEIEDGQPIQKVEQVICNWVPYEIIKMEEGAMVGGGNNYQMH
ncbi:amino acid transporter [Diplogelasinospora grovesii]|uniref:Amino acid transporter n=1 Tax=Diplogelasinospora grovesii TaxID=303347 RepID=A0AAN6MW82_9PEZI|nr:amino acid transporter [Diplogelasinospora grovesii]